LNIPKRDILIIPFWYNKVKDTFLNEEGEKMAFRLKELRKERNISQLKLALDLNMNQNTISRYENMEREADYETLMKFADYFGVSLDYLLGRTENR
jgi:ribosome-binding protein aMBF1 (putative translation factor)